MMKPLPRLVIYLHTIGVLGSCRPRYAQHVQHRHGCRELLRRLSDLDAAGTTETILMTRFDEAQGRDLLHAFRPFHKLPAAPLHSMTLIPGRHALDLHIAERAAMAEAPLDAVRYVYVDSDFSPAAPHDLTLAVAPHQALLTREGRQAAREAGKGPKDDGTLLNLLECIEILAETAPTPVAEAMPTLPHVNVVKLATVGLERCCVVSSIRPDPQLPQRECSAGR